MRPSRCKRCKCEVRWCTTPRGKRIMLDPLPDAERGTFRLEPEDHRNVVWALFVPEPFREVAHRVHGLYAAHRDTCRPLTVEDAVIDPIEGARAHDDHHAAGTRGDTVAADPYRTLAPVA